MLVRYLENFRQNDQKFKEILITGFPLILRESRESSRRKPLVPALSGWVSEKILGASARQGLPPCPFWREAPACSNPGMF